jgi:hypothetical protein
VRVGGRGCEGDTGCSALRGVWWCEGEERRLVVDLLCMCRAGRGSRRTGRWRGGRRGVGAHSGGGAA